MGAFDNLFNVKGTKPFLLVILEEFNRYPFVYLCNNMSSDTFDLFGFQAYIHSDRGSNLMSQEISPWLKELRPVILLHIVLKGTPNAKKPIKQSEEP